MSGQMAGLPEGYSDWLAQLKGSITQARQRAALAVNAELVRLYHRIGCEIQSRQQAHGWGAKVIERLALDLKDAFPDMKGFSGRNLKYMAFFAQHCPDGLIGQQPAAQLPWFHIVTLLTKLGSPEEREWYARQTVQHGWSRSALEQNIRNRLQLRQGAALNNFDQRLPAAESALAQSVLKDLAPSRLPAIAPAAPCTAPPIVPMAAVIFHRLAGKREFRRVTTCAL